MTPKYKTSLVTTVFFALLLTVPGSEARCNERAGSKTPATFELPQISKDAPPLQFDDPDPTRTLTPVPYSIDPRSRSVFLVGVSARLSPERAREVQQGILGLVQNSMCRPGDVMVVWSADPIARIATFRNGDRVQDCSDKWLKFKVANNQHEIAHLNRHFQKVREANHDGIADLNVPGLVHFLGQEFHEFGTAEYPNRVLTLFGSALFVDRNGGGFSLANAYPTIGMLRAPLSPFSTRDKGSYLGNTVTHWVVQEEDFRDSNHRLGLQSFWSAYFLTQNSPLLTFSPDTRVSERVMKRDLPAIPAYVDDVSPGFITIDPAPIYDLFGPVPPGRSGPSTVTRGSLTLGLKWDGGQGVDLDLHVGLRGVPGRLSFRNSRTDFGSLRKRVGSGWEEVRFFDEVAISDVSLAVNFYAGNAPATGARGELRISFAGQLFQVPIVFPPSARSGNGGNAGSAAHWLSVDPQAVVTGRN